VHFSAIQGGDKHRKLTEGDRVEFEVEKTQGLFP